MLIASTVVVARLPAPSSATPVRDWPAPSPETVCAGVQEATPDSSDWSSHAKRTVTSALFQPSAFAAVRVALIDGGVVSIRTVTKRGFSTMPSPSTDRYAKLCMPSRSAGTVSRV